MALGAMPRRGVQPAPNLRRIENASPMDVESGRQLNWAPVRARKHPTPKAERQRRRGLSALIKHHAEQMQAVEMIGYDGERPAIERRSLIQPACLLQFQRLGHQALLDAGEMHLDDGTHLHGVNIRIPGIPAVSVGYVQDRDGKLTELETASSRETFGDNGLPLSATLSLDPGEITGNVEVRGQAPVSLTAADGRVSQFPRAWVSVSTADGRTGIGWMEWNRNLAT